MNTFLTLKYSIVTHIIHLSKTDYVFINVESEFKKICGFFPSYSKVGNTLSPILLRMCKHA